MPEALPWELLAGSQSDYRDCCQGEERALGWLSPWGRMTEQGLLTGPPWVTRDKKWPATRARREL